MAKEIRDDDKAKPNCYEGEKDSYKWIIKKYKVKMEAKQ